MQPTITSVTPSRGAADGQTLVEVRGSGFRLPPPQGGVPVRVALGGRRATGVLVYGEDELTCLTPVGDLFDEVVSGTFGGGLFTAIGHRVREGARLRWSDGAPSPLLPPGHKDAVAYYAFDVAPGLSLRVSLVPGVGPAIAVANGPAELRTEGYADVVVENLDDAGQPIPGENAALPAAFSYRRPDLSKPGALVRLEQALVRDLRRVHGNVAVTTNVDYDAQTGDYVALVHRASLPALLLTNPRLRDSRARHLSGRWARVVGDGSRFVERRARRVKDVRFLLVAVTDNHEELLNLREALEHHFEKTGKLGVRRGPASGPLDEVAYDLHASFAETAVEVQPSQGSVESLGMEIVVFGVVLEASEGMPQDLLPGEPAGLHHEATTAYGYTLESPELDVDEKP